MKKAKILIEHRVKASVADVFAGFTRELFEVLSPAFPPAKLLRYDGNRVGDEVHIQLGFPPLAQQWISVITDYGEGDKECFFIDEGRQLPFPLKYWQHRHIIRYHRETVTSIFEDITYGTSAAILTGLMRPIIFKQFDARGPKYRKFFEGSEVG